jgi:Cu(I)/Ag(I) efflux system periplasmic protein CusF
MIPLTTRTKVPTMNYGFISAALSLVLIAGTSATQAASPWGIIHPAVGPTALQLVHEGHAGAAQASGVVNIVDATQRKLNVSHGPIKQLGWPAMTMDFPVGGDVDLTTVKPGMKINFTLVRGSGGVWTVDTLKPSGRQ